MTPVRHSLRLPLAVLLAAALVAPAIARADDPDPAIPASTSFDLPNGRFVAVGEDGLGLTGFAVIDETGGPPFWTAYAALGAEETLGKPLSRPFSLPDARVYQLFEYGMLHWRPGAPFADLAETLDLMWAAGRDDWLFDRGVPRAVSVESATAGQPALARIGWLTVDAIRDEYFGATYPGAQPGVDSAVQRYGLPAAPPEADETRIVQRFDKAVLQLDLTSGSLAALPVGELLRLSGLLPPGPLAPDRLVGGQLVARAPRASVAWPNSRGWGVPGPATFGPPDEQRGAGGPAAVAAPPPSATPSVPATATSAPVPTSTPRPGSTSAPPTTAASQSSSRATPTGAAAVAGAALSIKAVVNQGRAEHVVIANEGSAPQELTGWVIRSATGGQVLPFPAGFVLAAGATVNVHSGSGASSQNHPPTDLFATGANVWNNNGDTAQLVDPSGRIVHQLSYAG